MKRTLLCLTLAIAILWGTVVHGITYFPTEHAPGEAYRTVNAENCIAADNAEVLTDGSVRINAGGSATFGFHTPYHLRGAKLVYGEAADNAITLTTKTNQYNITLPEGGSECSILFHEVLGKEKQDYVYNHAANGNGFQREYVEHLGEHEVTVSSEKGILLKEMVFEAELVPYQANERNIPDVTEETSATYSTIMLDEDATIIVANGGKRFVDYNDTAMKPYKYNDRLYLPINTLAKALEYYHEDYPEKGYALMRSATHDVVFLDGKCWLIEGVAKERLINEEVIIHRDGKTLAAVRYFAELIGDTVDYQDGFVVIDNKYTVADIMAPGKLNTYAKNIFKPFKAEQKIGKAYYVAQNHPAATDDGTGSADAPFKTISRAAEIAEAGDTVIVKEGIYRETLTPKNSGTAEAPITFMAAEGENVVISANEVMDNWVQFDGNIWTAPMGWDLGVTRNQVFINDKMLNEARYPNGPEVLYDTEKLDNAWAVKGDLWRPAGNENANSVRSSTLLWQTEPDYWKGGYFIGHFGHDYAVKTANIIGSKEGELILGDEKSREWDTLESYFEFGYIVGHMNCLDAPGEWIHQNNTLYMIFPEDATPNQTVVEAKARQLVIDLKGKNHVYVKGFKTIGGSARTNDGQMNMLNGLDMKYISHYIHQSDSYKGGIEFPFNPKDENGAPERGEAGIFLSGADNHVVNCHIDHTAGAGIFLAGLYSYIENNIIHDSYNSNYVSGIYMASRGYEEKNQARGGASVFNNTIYKTGRSCYSISSQDGMGTSPYLPSEFAYNDFHDAMMTTLDTGVTYEYNVQQCIDGYYSKLHHNYVYLLSKGNDYNPYTMTIYHDGGSRGFDTYKNQIFYIDKDSPFKNARVYVQPFLTYPAYMRVWDNGYNILSEGTDGLKEEYFSEEKPYYAGAMLDYRTMEPIDYTVNYDRFKAGQFTMEHTVAKTYEKNPANLSDGVEYDAETGYATFTGNDQYVCFEDVDFPEKANAIALTFRGDSHYSHDNFEIVIGESIETGQKFSGMVDLDGHDMLSPERIVVEISNVTGVQDVWFKITDYKSAELGGISVYKDEMYETTDTTDEYSIYTAYRWGGDFTDRIQFTKADDDVVYGGDSTGPRVVEVAGYLGRKSVNWNWPGWYIKYDDVVFTKDTDKLSMLSRVEGVYSDEPVEIYIEDKNSTEVLSERVARFTVDGRGWSNTLPQTINLEKIIEAGTHDVYIKLCPDAGFDKTFTLVYLGFMEKGAMAGEILENISKTYGGAFNIEKSISNSDFPLRATYMNPPNYNNKGLTYTLPGSCAVYENVTLLGDCNIFKMNYACEKGFDGQPVEVWIGDPGSNGEKVADFVTESTGSYNLFEEIVVPCSKVIPSGTYTVYLKFGGDANERKTCSIEKFNFSYR